MYALKVRTLIAHSYDKIFIAMLFVMIIKKLYAYKIKTLATYVIRNIAQ